MGKTNKIKYGLKNVYYAKATIDDNGEITYATPVHIPGAVSLSLDAEGETEPWYADNMVYVTLNNNSGYSGDLEVALIPGSFYEDILHEERNEDNLLLENTNVDFEHFALMFQFQGDKKAIRHVLYNCTCSRPAIESATTEDTKEPQTDTLSLTAFPIKSGYVKAKTCEATPDEIYDGWFDAVYIPEEAPVEKTYTVRFYDGNTLLEMVTDVAYGSSVTYSGVEPSKTGYTFTGWDPDPSYVTADMRCYAQYQINTYTVEFWNDNELLQTVTVEYGGSTIYTGPTPTREGYVFTEWAPEPSNITEDTKCYAQFRVATYTVEFWNEDMLLESVVVEYGKGAVFSGTEPGKEGYTFIGWDPEPTNVTEDMKCEAQFQINTYTVEFWNGDDLLETVTAKYGSAAVYSGADPEKEGYTFTGWEPEPVNVTADLKCYAQFQINVYTVEFWNGEELLESVSVEYGGTAAYSGADPEREGYTFTGWDPDPSYVTSNMACYAQFEELNIIGFAIYSEDDNSLIFYGDSSAPEAGSDYNGKKATSVYTGVESTPVFTDGVDIPWYDVRSEIKTVFFDKSFSSVRPIRTAYWFYRFTSCESIDLTNINTSKVTDMQFMFAYSSSLQEVDVSPLDISSVTDIQGMFERCSALTLIDVSMLDSSNITSIAYMFERCSNLVTIYSDDDVFVMNRVIVSSNMFKNCSKLVGGAGTVYDEDKVDAEMAHVDNRNNPGYFTAK